jgi:cytochrome c oxidase assembly factor CtaG
MSPTLDAFLRSWPSEPWLVASLLLSAAIYYRGWRILHRRDASRWSAWRLASFFGGLFAIFLALASPLEPFATLLLQVHMVQHLLLMMVAPPLIWLGAPLFPMVRGLPAPIRTVWVAPLLRSRRLRRWFSRLTHPLVAWPIYVGATWFWHAPRFYELALSSGRWHFVEHAAFVAAAMLFWYPVVRPYPSRPTWSPWLLFPYLLLADVQNTVLAAWLTFSSRVIYPHYANGPRIAGISALDDQAGAGVIMWVPGSIAFLLPLFVVGLSLLRGSSATERRLKQRAPQNQRRAQRHVTSPLDSSSLGETTSCSQGREPLESAAFEFLSPGRGDTVRCEQHNQGLAPLATLLRPSGAETRSDTNRELRAASLLPILDQPPRAQSTTRFDLLCVPLVGALLRWRYFRPLLQTSVGLLAVAVIIDGLLGPQLSPLNLAGVLPWIHWRGLLILGLLIAGNLFCMACPFTLPRAIARRLRSPTRSWPRALKNKWLAVALVALFLWSYEAFALWDSPWLTAWIALAYFAIALAVDAFFQGASFCKYVCPIGQFNFVQSLVSPLEVAVREPSVCTTCKTKECIRGSATLPGCEMGLYQPRKLGNFDCTFCLDCIHACPHENIGVLSVAPGATLWSDRFRAGIGRLSARPDIAALTLVLVFGAFANAAGMVAPVLNWQDRLRTTAGIASPLAMTTLFYALAIVALPLIAVSIAARLSRRWSHSHESTPRLATRYAFALIPLGFAMWLAHYSFHFFTSWEALIPATQRFASDLGVELLGPPAWICACCRPTADWVLRLELLALGVGLLATLYAALCIAESQTASARQAVRAALPWSLLALVLYAGGVWILLQPMQMRGTLPADAAVIAQSEAQP